MDRYERILESIKNSKKEIKILPVSNEVLNYINKIYEINELVPYSNIVVAEDIIGGISFYPFLWAEADSLESRYREEVPMSEIIKLEFDFLNS